MHFSLPHYREDVEAFERVPKRFVGMLPGLENISYCIRRDWTNVDCFFDGALELEGRPEVNKIL